MTTAALLWLNRDRVGAGLRRCTHCIHHYRHFDHYLRHTSIDRHNLVHLDYRNWYLHQKAQVAHNHYLVQATQMMVDSHYSYLADLAAQSHY